jgi:hypothetical protein
MSADGMRARRAAANARARIALAAVLLLAGCVSQETKRDAINDVNVEFKAQYEAVLAKSGTRLFDATPDVGFDAVNAALTRLGLVIEQRSRALGFLSAEAPAPRPLDRAEWDRAAAADLPQARSILSRHIGALSAMFNFEPEGLDTVITATVIEVRGRSEISLTMRMREVAPPKQDLPRREYPPPTAVQAGLDKIWGVVDREIASRRR